MVATVTAITSAQATVHYFEHDGYYAKGDPSHRRASFWHGRAAGALGMARHVSPGPFEKVLAGHVPKTGLRLGRIRDGGHQHRPGVDITFSAPKSVSLQALLLNDRRVVRAHDEAVRATLDFIERDLLVTRLHNRATGRRDRIRADGMVAAAFRHVASRNLDPQLHTHAIVANMTRGPDGGWRSLDTGRLHGQAHLIGAYYRNELARYLREQGHVLVPTMIGRVPGFEIAGWDREVLDAFSSRRRDILAYMEERGWDYSAARTQKAALHTRARKKEPGLAALRERWILRGLDLGIGPGRRKKHTPAPEAAPLSALEIVARSAEHLEERSAVFPVRELLAQALAHAPGMHSLEEIESAIGQLRHDGHLIDAIRSRGGPALVTDRTVRAEQRVLAFLREWRGKGGPAVPEGAVEAALAQSRLTAGQKAAVRLILLGSDRMVGVQGYAGTGKTTMLRQVVELAGAGRIIGLAPSASAARTLSREAGIATRTLQWFLARHQDSGPEDAAGFEGMILVVDEMSLASTDQTLRLLRIAERLRLARVVLVGDAKQLRAVDAGQPFRQLQQAGMAMALMDDIRRQRSLDLRTAVLDVIAGEPGRALIHLGADLHEVAKEDLGETAARVWLELPPERRDGTALLAPTHELRHTINRVVRGGLRGEGVLHGRVLELPTLTSLHLTRAQKGDIRNYRTGDVVVFHNNILHYRVRSDDICPVEAIEGPRLLLSHSDGRPRHIVPDSDIRYRLDLCETGTIEVQAGDRIRWTRNDKKRDLLNGHTAQIVQIAARTLDIETEDGRRLRFAHDDAQLRYIAHAYASTVHAAQGLTRDAVIAVLDSGHGLLSTQQTFYVEISRARDNAIVLTDNLEQLAETLEENTGETLTALEAIGAEEAWLPPRVLQKAPVPEIRVDPESLRRWRHAMLRHRAEATKAACHPCEQPGYEALLESLHDATPALDEAARRRAAAELAEETGSAARHLARRIAGCLDRREAVIGPEAASAGMEAVDHRGYGGWRSSFESVLASARAVYAIAPATDPPLHGSLEDARAILAGDDRLAAARSAAARAGAWQEEWRALAAGGLGSGVYGHARSGELIVQAERIVEDETLPETLRTDLRLVIDTHRARDAAAGNARTWLTRWNAIAAEAKQAGIDPFGHDGANGLIEEARTLLENDALPDAERTMLQEPVGAHDARQALVEAARAWFGQWRACKSGAKNTGIDILDHEAAAALIGKAPMLIDNQALPDAYRADLKARVGAYDARHDARRIARSWLEQWGACEDQAKNAGIDILDHGAAAALIARARALLYDQALPEAERTGLKARADAFKGRLATRQEARSWLEQWRACAAEAKNTGVDILDHEAAAALIGNAPALLDDQALPEAERANLRARVDAYGARHAARRNVRAWLGQWRTCEAEAKNTGIDILDHEAAAALIGNAPALLDDQALPEAERANLRARVDAYGARHAARRNVRAWLGQWRTCEAEAKNTGIDILDHEAAAALIGRASVLLDDQALPETERANLRARVDAYGARHTARRNARAWFGQWGACEAEAKNTGIDILDHEAAAALIGRAPALLDDQALPEAERTGLKARVDAFKVRLATRQEARAWLEQWRACEGEAGELGFDVHDHGKALSLVGRAQGLLAGSVVPEGLRDALRYVVDAHATHLAMRQQGEACLQALQEHSRTPGPHAIEAVMGKARELAASPAMPLNLGRRLNQQVDIIERQSRSAAERDAAEAARLDGSRAGGQEKPARRPGQDRRSAGHGASDTGSGPPGDEARRKAELEARRKSQKICKALENWQARLAENSLDLWIADAMRAAANPNLASRECDRLETALTVARQRFAANEAFAEWHEECEQYRKTASVKKVHPFDLPAHEGLVSRAGKFASVDLLSDRQQRVGAFLREDDRVRRKRQEFDSVAGELRGEIQKARAQGAEPFENDAVQEMFRRIRSLVHSDVLDPDRRNIFARIEAGHKTWSQAQELRQSRERRRDKSQSRGGGISM